MKNVKPSQLRTSIVLNSDEFESTLKTVFGENARAWYYRDGIQIDYDDTLTDEDCEDCNADCDECPKQEPPLNRLAEYFGVSKITSIHCGHRDCPGIWIHYQE